ncbi:hypothetical protein PoB_004958500 [Plakobranchus ocellatus]|uniref:Uncharacterized protein n=1 Tax=Plakobranchus ocellatus TaxID=259542 RepID=A0AAV4BR66_9GAST|nr:hypothetical protein PoB_004958500 [Plakobranchus ocellatus]
MGHLNVADSSRTPDNERKPIGSFGLRKGNVITRKSHAICQKTEDEELLLYSKKIKVTDKSPSSNIFEDDKKVENVSNCIYLGANIAANGNNTLDTKHGLAIFFLWNRHRQSCFSTQLYSQLTS